MDILSAPEFVSRITPSIVVREQREAGKVRVNTKPKLGVSQLPTRLRAAKGSRNTFSPIVQRELTATQKRR